MLPIYQNGQAAEYCQQRGWQYKQSGDELVLTECPFCAKKQKMYWNNLTGAFDCKSADCARRGNYFTMRRDTGDPVSQPFARAANKDTEPKVRPRVALSKFVKYEEALLANPAAMDYLTMTRGLTLETIKKWHLGLKREEKADHHLDDIDGPID